MFRNVNKNAMGLLGSCLINNILYMFLNTFMIAYFIKLTNYDYRLISIYYILSFSAILLIFLFFGKIVKNRSQVLVFRSGIILYCIYILVIALLKEKIVIYYLYLGIFYGIVQGLFWVAGHTLINEYTKNIENSFISIKSILSKILKIFFPIIFGVSIQLTSFSYISRIVIVLSIIQFLFSLLIKDRTRGYYEKYNLKEYLSYIKSKKRFKTIYKIIACDGIVNYLLETLITILIVMTFKTTLSLGIITTICSICFIISVYIFQYKLKSNQIILKISSIMMVISVILLIFSINRTTIIIYNLCNSIFLVLLINTAETKNYNITSEDIKITKKYIVEHQVTSQVILNISRIIGYLILFVASLFNNMIFFKLLLVLVTVVIIFYTNFMVSLNKKTI